VALNPSLRLQTVRTLVRIVLALMRYMYIVPTSYLHRTAPEYHRCLGKACEP